MTQYDSAELASLERQVPMLESDIKRREENPTVGAVVLARQRSSLAYIQERIAELQGKKIEPAKDE